MLSVLLIVLSSLSFAETKLMVPMSIQRIPVEVNPLSMPTASQYKELQKKFDRGRTVEVEELKGTYSGRCFFFDSPSRAVATALVADTDHFTRTNGPAFKGADYRHITPLFDVYARATKFDAISASDNDDNQRLLRSVRDLNAFPVRSNDELVVQGYRTTDLESRVYRLRKSDGYIVLKLECAEHDYCSNFSGWTSNKFLAYEGEPIAYCYYFRKSAFTK